MIKLLEKVTNMFGVEVREVRDLNKIRKNQEFNLLNMEEKINNLNKKNNSKFGFLDNNYF